MSGNFVPGPAVDKLGTVARPWRALRAGDVYADRVVIGPTRDFGLEFDFRTGEGTRLRDAVGGEFDGVGPWARRRCNLADDGSVTAYYGDSDYAEDGSHGMVMVEQPAFWYRVSAVDVESYTALEGPRLLVRRGSYSVSPYPQANYKLHPAFIDSAGRQNDRIYIGAYEGSLLAGKLASVAGQAIADVSGGARLRNQATARGAGWHTMYYAAVAAEAMLLAIEYGGFDLQRLLARGNTTGGIQTPGLSSGLGNGSGGGDTYVCWRGEENLWGNSLMLCDGVSATNRMLSVASRLASYPRTETGIVLPEKTGWTSAFGYAPTFDWVLAAAETAGSSAGPVGECSEPLVGNMAAVCGGQPSSDLGGADGPGPCVITNYSAEGHCRAERLLFVPSEVG